MMQMRVDRFHTGVRVAALVLWLATIGVLFLVGRWIGTLLFGTVTGFGVLVLAVLAFVAAQPVSFLAERQLVKVWPSGRTVTIDGAAITLRQKSGSVRVDLVRPASFRRWRFEVRTQRGGHVPNGHHCLALRLAQDEQAMTLYAFVPPAQLKDFSALYPFYELRRTNDIGLPPTPLAGREQAYLDAENDRWIFGAELDAADLVSLLSLLADRLPDFADRPASEVDL